jgi:hypothetical protein
MLSTYTAKRGDRIASVLFGGGVPAVLIPFYYITEISSKYPWFIYIMIGTIPVWMILSYYRSYDLSNNHKHAKKATHE